MSKWPPTVLFKGKDFDHKICYRVLPVTVSQSVTGQKENISFFQNAQTLYLS